MAKTGTEDLPGTAEGAAMGRALHTRLAEEPILNDFWAVHLLSSENQAVVLAATDAGAMSMIDGFDASPIFAVNVGCLRFGEDVVTQCIEAGIDQYLVLGAGLDTFALRRGDLAGRVTILEVDYPDVQAVKRGRIAACSETPAIQPQYVALDFESERLDEKLHSAGFDSSRPTVVSWLNTVHYLSEEAVKASLKDLSSLLCQGSRLVINYAPDVEFSAQQIVFIEQLLAVTDAASEPMKSRWRPADFEALLAEAGFKTLQHVDEVVLTKRYFSTRVDGLYPGIPLRVLVAERLL